MSIAQHETESHHLPATQVAAQQRKAVLFFILADAVVLGCLLFAYFYLRALNVDNAWLSDDNPVVAAAWKTWLIAGVTVVSALVYRYGERGIAAGKRSTFLAGALIGALLVVLAIVLVIYQMRTWGILMSDGSYASTFIVMTGVQLAHLVLLLILAIGIWNRGTRGKLDDGNYTHATVVGYFWYWVALAGVLSALTTFFVT